MSDDSEGDEYMELSEVPDGAMVSQCGAVVKDEEGVIGEIDITQFEDPELIDERNS